MISTIAILQAIIADIKSPVIADVIGPVTAGVFTVTSSATSWLHFNQKLTIEGNPYKVTAFEQNVSFDLSQIEHANVITGSFDIIPPPFFVGTWKMTTAERDDFQQYKDKTPFIWLYEVRDERIKLELTSAVDRDADNLRLFFMAESNFGDWLTRDHYDNVLDPLSVLVREWLAAVRRSRYVSKSLDGEMRTTNHANAGSVDKDGHLKALFNEELSGIEGTLTLPINKCST